MNPLLSRGAALQKFLRAFTVALMNEDIPPIPPAELDMAIDEDNKTQGRGPEQRTAEQGVADMLERIRYVKEQLRQLGFHPDDGSAVSTLRRRYQSDLTEAQQRLAEYQAQLKAKN